MRSEENKKTVILREKIAIEDGYKADIIKLKEKITELQKDLNKERDRKNAFTEANFVEKYNKIIEENAALKQKDIAVEKYKEKLVLETEGLRIKIEELYGRGYIQDDLYLQLMQMFSSLEEDYSSATANLAFDYENFNVLISIKQEIRYLNGSAISLFNGHKNPIYYEDNRREEIFKYDFVYDCVV